MFRVLFGRCAAVFGFFLLAGGCMSDGGNYTAPPTMKRVEVPVITPQAETKQSQEKGGLEISIAPVAYVPKTHEKVTIEPADPSLKDAFFGSGMRFPVRKTTTTTVQVEPDRLCFLVTINNKLPRVFYGAGTIVQFNAGGRLLAVDQRGYTNFLGAIIPPRQQTQLTIVGPALSELTQKRGVVGVFLYDVVTNKNEAGVVTEKQNYEWYFDYTLAPREVEISATRSERLSMSYTEYQQEMMKQQTQQTREMYRDMMQAQPGLNAPGQPYPAYPNPTQ